MRKTLTYLVAATAALIMAAGCGSSKKFVPGTEERFPALNQNGKTAIVAHRGYWNCPEAGYMENTIASLRMAQENGLWGSEFDVQLTSDDVVIVNHNNNIQGLLIWDNPYKKFAKMTLKNGEHPSTLDQYLVQGKKCKTTMLVLELKPQKNLEREDVLWTKTVESLKAHKLYDPKRVVFITFSKHLCDRIAAEAPQFVNQYLNGDIAPETLSSERINGIDYNDKVISKHPEYVKDAHAKGMSVNVWTVNKEKDMKSFAKLCVDAITTNEPMTTRKVLGNKEFKLAK